MSKLLTKAEVMKRFGVGEKTVTNWIKAGCPVSAKQRKGAKGRPAKLFDPEKLKGWVLVNAYKTRGDEGETIKAAHNAQPIKTSALNDLGIMGCLERTRQQERKLFELIVTLLREDGKATEIGNATRAHTAKTAELRQVEMTALEWQERTGKLVGLADAKRLFSELSTGVRERVMGMPNQVIPQLRQYLRDEDDGGKVRDIIDNALRHALTAMPDALPERGKK
jgi:phage terminase Nu1 subunit (DNA packaging protein)